MIGSNYPLFIKFGIRDESERGLKLEEGIQVARWMIEAGIDAIEVSAGVASPHGATPKLKPGELERVFFRERSSGVWKVVCGVYFLQPVPLGTQS